jgi:RNA polymerase sigma-70 factor (ECF subfamily)
MGPEQLADLVDRYATALVLYARQWCACPEDVVQTAFLKLVRIRTPPDNLLPWLYRVVRNGAIDASRAARRRYRYEAAAADSAPRWFAPSYDPSGLDAQAAAAALADLPAETREIIVAHIWGGLTFEQIAEAVGSSAATCYRRYAAGLEVLRQKLGAERPAHTK